MEGTAKGLDALPVGRYRLIARVGEGGMGDVYRAVDDLAGGLVAVKIMRPEWRANAAVRRRFHTEREALRRLDHPHIARLLDGGETPEGLPYLVLEWLKGEDLSAVLLGQQPLSQVRIARVADQLLRALGAAHANGVAHGDIKPENVVLQRRGRRDVVKLIDFGLAQVAAGLEASEPDARGSQDLARRQTVPITAEQSLCGTPEYMAPELIAGAPPDAGSDLYAVAVLIYELLVGATPFASRNLAEVLSGQLHDAPVPPSLRNPSRATSPALDAILLRALAKSPAERYRGADELRQRLLEAFRCSGHAPEWRCADCEEPLARPGSSCTVCGAPATGSAPAAARREAPTRPVAVTSPPGPGAPLLPPRPLESLHDAIGAAIAAGDPDAIVARYSVLAVALVDRGKVTAAIAELEEAVDLVTAGEGASAAGPRMLWRLLLWTARLYARERRWNEAHTRAQQSLAHAARTGNPSGMALSRRLLDELRRPRTSMRQPARRLA